MTGSAARDAEDRWSDIDLAFGIRESDELPRVLADWTAHMYEAARALHHLDVRSGAWLYRVFLLPTTLQVDIAFVPAAEFRARAPSFRLVSGEAQEARHAPPPDPLEIIGLGWLYALHARSSIARGRLWQAEYMISAFRDHALALACIRHALPSREGRGLDSLPAEVAGSFEASLVRNLEKAELSRAFAVAITGFLVEVRAIDGPLAERLEPALKQLGGS